MYESIVFAGEMTPPQNGVVADLLSEALALLDNDRAAARSRIEHARALAGQKKDTVHHVASGLAAWQLRRVETYIRSNINHKIRIVDVANQIHLSKSHFSRVFKATTGVTFSEFLIKTRIDRAKSLLITTRASICEIALQCGFSDQPHLTRLFKRSGELTPGSWRRLNLCSLFEATV